ncbi:uncharacterized protein TNCV_3450691 [Trichonephila clavipes]|uniref:Ubiquitin-like protease family profile domain-containing protein n=1 Tax=Trichonephila clavipes TaxID=2585209 RepID=A0A8X6WLS6_TRICX|nr:uncharacterized protein TNCV_3450691 [Trichonephila clavipes]
MDSLVLNRLSLSDSRLRYGFSGVYSSDKLPKQRKRYRSFIVNTDPAHFKGRHWQAIYFRQDNHCVFFCSYGTRPQYDIEQFIIENSTSFEWNENILQHPNTMTCGLFCLYFCGIFLEGYQSTDCRMEITALMNDLFKILCKGILN